MRGRDGAREIKRNEDRNILYREEGNEPRCLTDVSREKTLERFPVRKQ